MGLLLYSRFARGTPSVSLRSTDLRRSACLLPAQRAANSTPSKREPFWALYDSLFFSFTRVTFYLQSRPPSSREVARQRRDGRSRLASRRILLQSRFARQLPQRGSPFGRFMTPCFSIHKSNFCLQSKPPSSRDVARQRRDGRSRPPQSPLRRFTISCKTARFAFIFLLSALAPFYQSLHTRIQNVYQFRHWKSG